MPEETCPWCGAAATSDSDWSCGSYIDDGQPQQSWTCSDRQLAAVTAERDELRQRIAGAPVAWAVIAHNPERMICVNLDRNDAEFEADSRDEDDDRVTCDRVRLVIDQETDHA